MKHTAGKWKAMKEINESIPAALSFDGIGIVCEVPGRTKDERNANAQLIAAAPELLEALQEWTEYAVNKDIPFKLITKTRTIIAKAEGR